MSPDTDTDTDTDTDIDADIDTGTADLRHRVRAHPWLTQASAGLGPARLVLRRWASGPSTLALLALVVGLVTATLAVAAAARGTVLDAGVRAAIASAPPAGRAVEVAVRLDGADARRAASQDAAVRHALAAALAPGVAGPSAVVRSARTGPLTVAGRAERLVALAAADLPDHARLTAGSWPDATAAASAGPAGPALPATLQADAAAALDLHVGATFEIAEEGLGPLAVRVVGLWRAADAADPFWFGAPLELTGTERAGVLGPLALPVPVEAAPATLQATWTARWRVGIDPVSLAAADLPGLRAGLAGLPDALDRVSTAGGAAPSVSEGFGELLGATQPAAAATSTTVTGLLLLLSALAAALVALAAALVGGQRAQEALTLRARGGSRGQRFALSLGEALAVVALVIGPVLVLVAAAVRVLGAADPSPGGLGRALMASLIAVVTVAAACAMLLAAGVETVLAPASTRLPGRVARARPIGALLAVAAAGLLAAWQLARADAVIGRADPVLAVAPAALLVAGSVLAVRGLQILTRPAALLARRPGAVPALLGWEAARRSARPATPVVAVVLAGATVVVLGATAATMTATVDERARRAIGADVAVRSDTDAAPTVSAVLARTPGAGVRTPVALAQTLLSGRTARIAAVDASSVAAATRGAGALAITAATARALGGQAGSGAAAQWPLLTPGRQLEAVLRAGPAGPHGPVTLPSPVPPGFDGAEATAHLTALLVGPAGVGTAVGLPVVPADGAAHRVRVALPAAQALRLAGFDLTATFSGLSDVDPASLPPDQRPYALADRVRVDLVSLEVVQDGGARTAVLGPASWTPLPDVLSGVHARRATAVGGTPGAAFARVEATGSFPGQQLALRVLVGDPFTRGALPVAVDRAVADDLNVSEGAQLAIGNGGGSVFAVQVAAVVDDLPDAALSEDPLLLADLGSYVARVLRSGGTFPAVPLWWVGTASGDIQSRAVAAAVRAEAAEAGVRVDVHDVATLQHALRSDPFLQSVRRLLLLAALACACVAAAVLVIGDAVTTRARRGELSVLRALGASPRQVATLLAAERLAVGAAAVLLGLALGAVAVPLVVPRFAAAALVLLGRGVSTAGPASPGLDAVELRLPWWVLALVAATGLLLCAVAALHRARRAGAGGAVGLLREEVR